MTFGKLEKILLTLCVASIVAVSGRYICISESRVGRVDIEREEREYISVEVCGEVESPDTYRIYENSRVCDAIYAAGGITNNADVDVLKLDAILTDKARVYVPSITEYRVDGIPMVNINTADENVLTIVPGIGETTAQRIVQYRNENGNFKSIYDIMRVRGIGEKKFEEIKDYIKTEE